MSETTSTPTPTETLRERVRGALATVPLGEDDVHVFYVAEKHLDRLTDAVLAAVSTASSPAVSTPRPRMVVDHDDAWEAVEANSFLSHEAKCEVHTILDDLARPLAAVSAAAPDERLCYSDECGEPCQSWQAMKRDEIERLRRENATIAQRLGEARAALAARPAPVVNAGPLQVPREERDALRAVLDEGQQYEMGSLTELFWLRDVVDRVPALLDALDAAEAEIERLRSALDHLREDDALNRDAYLLVEAQRDAARAEAAALRTQYRDLATYRTAHANLGLCPEGPDDEARDPDCPVCRALGLTVADEGRAEA